MWCPSCNIALQSQAITCANCKADFSNLSGWKPLQIQPTGAVKKFTEKIQSSAQPTESKAAKLVGGLLVAGLVFLVLFWMIFYIIFHGAGGH